MDFALFSLPNDPFFVILSVVHFRPLLEMNIFADLPNRQASKYGDREQLRYRDYLTDEWTSMSWNELRHTVERVAVALYDMNVEEQGRICLFT